MAGEDRVYVDWIKEQPCALADRDCIGPIDPHHRPRVHGGKRSHDHTCIPVCRMHHDQIQHPKSLEGSPLAGLTRDEYLLWHDELALTYRGVYALETGPEPTEEPF